MSGAGQRTVVSPQAALEESWFLGLRLARGISLIQIAAKFGSEEAVNNARAASELIQAV
jgi:coproporphyrinogen III oxidase-like Fe-S oxidoreductase